MHFTSCQIVSVLQATSSKTHVMSCHMALLQMHYLVDVHYVHNIPERSILTNLPLLSFSFRLLLVANEDISSGQDMSLLRTMKNHKN